jgi:hypothetical protein
MYFKAPSGAFFISIYKQQERLTGKCMLNRLLNYSQIYTLWLNKGSTKEAAIELTLQQIDALEEIVNDNYSWQKLMEISARGRNHDAWLAGDWPAGFDELLLCVPLCKLVAWECSKCTVGKRQENNSCAHDYSLFGYIGELVKNGLRDELAVHLLSVKKMLRDERYLWNMHRCEVEIVSG